MVPSILATHPKLVAMAEASEIVECHSEYTYAERPTALQWEGERLAIEAVEDAWRIPGGRKFRVRVEDGRIFELFYGELFDEWRILAL